MAIAIAHSLARRVLATARWIAEESEQGQAAHDHRCADHLAAPHVLARQEVAERQREDNGRNEQRLDDREASSIERRGLEHIAGQQRQGADQPHPLTDEARERLGVPKRDLREVQRALLLQRRCEGEEERRHEGECGGHALSLRRTASQRWRD